MIRWEESDREVLGRRLGDAVVVLAVGAVEQHGPHLATGTDIRIAAEVALEAARRAQLSHGVEVVVAPAMPFGVSAHHVPFGGTLSLRPATMLAVLTDLLRSMVAAGARRVVVVNGHGGNVGVVHAACAEVSAASDAVIAHVDYWRLLEPDGDQLTPGHAGAFETSVMMALGWSGEARGPERPVLERAPDSALTVHSQRRWRDIDGCSDDPADADAEAGRRIFDQVADALAAELVLFAGEPT